jgi:signal transduction histidine kinase
VPRPGLRRLLTALAVILVGVAQMQAVVIDLRSHSRLRERAFTQARATMLAQQPVIEAILGAGSAEAWQNAARNALMRTAAAEAEVLDLRGNSLAAAPRPAPVAHWPAASDLRPGAPPLVVGPVAGSATRLLGYQVLSAGSTTVVLRVAWAATDVVEDMRERRVLWILQALALAGLLVAGLVLLSPSGRGSDGGEDTALHAYEQAVERLRDRGDALRREHDAERRHMEERIEDREAMARAGELTAGIVHEVRNGLGTIVGHARLIERAPDSAAVQESAVGIREECETLEVVVRRFMEFVKRETLQRSTFDLGRLLARVVARENRGRPGAVVQPVELSGLAMRADEELLERALENVVRNAREAAGPQGRVDVHATIEGEVARIVVADDGPGRAAALRASLRPFFTTTPGGLGLGLPIAIKIVALHGGRLDFVDRDPRGLAVVLELPAAGDD